MAYNYTADKKQTKQDFNRVIMEATKQINKRQQEEAVSREATAEAKRDLNKQMTAQEILNRC